VPEILVSALISEALLFGWPRVALGLWVLYGMALSPEEPLLARVCDFSTPSGRLDPRSSDLFLTVRKPKSRWAAARRQHARCNDPWLVKLFETIRAVAGRDAMFLLAGMGWFRWRFQVLCDKLPVVYGETTHPRGIVLASFRAGKASALFELTRDLSYVGWRLRVKGLDTLKHYVQELGCQSYLSDQTRLARRRIQDLSGLLPVLVPTAVQWLEAGINPASWPLLWESYVG